MRSVSFNETLHVVGIPAREPSSSSSEEGESDGASDAKSYYKKCFRKHHTATEAPPTTVVVVSEPTNVDLEPTLSEASLGVDDTSSVFCALTSDTWVPEMVPHFMVTEPPVLAEYRRMSVDGGSRRLSADGKGLLNVKGAVGQFSVSSDGGLSGKSDPLSPSQSRSVSSRGNPLEVPTDDSVDDVHFILNHTQSNDPDGCARHDRLSRRPSVQALQEDNWCDVPPAARPVAGDGVDGVVEVPLMTRSPECKPRSQPSPPTP